MSKRISRPTRIVAALTAVVFVTVIFREIARINATTVGFAYLITILMIAASWGLTESVLASVVATFCLNYFFLPPVGTWAISEPENLVALFAFLLSSLIASNLSDRARRRTTEASNRRLEMERLYELSRSIMVMKGDEPIGLQIADEMVRIYEIPAVAIYDRPANVVSQAGRGSIDSVERRLKDTALT